MNGNKTYTAEEAIAVLKENSEIRRIIDNMPPDVIRRAKEPDKQYTLTSFMQGLIGPYCIFAEEGVFLVVPPAKKIEKFYNDLIFRREDGLANRYLDLAARLQAAYIDLMRTDIPAEDYMERLVEFDRMHNEFMATHANALRAFAPRNEKYPYQTGIE